MQIHTFSAKTSLKSKKRVGRGGKRGTTSGKGQKGQGSRAGRKKRPAERDILSKFPKFRGIGNAANRGPAIFEIYVDRIHEFAGPDGVLTKKMLVAKKLIPRYNYPVKIILRGVPKTAFTIEGITASAGARKKIEEKGGKIS